MKEKCLCTIGTLAFGSGLILCAQSASAASVAANSLTTPYAQWRQEQAGIKKQQGPIRTPGQGGIAGTACLGDTNGDNVVDVQDLLNVINAWGPCPANPACKSSTHDCCTTGEPGCTDIDCCAIVCSIDPFCCDVAWDGICVNEANDFCNGGAYCFAPPANNLCADRIDIFDGATPYHTIGATTDGPAHASCDFFGFPGIDNDIWFNYTATATGDLCVQTCGSAYDTKIAVYDGCACPVGDANKLACNDDSCGLQSEVTVSVVAGNCYKIRVGGYVGASGQGTVTITPGGCPTACPNPKHDCFTTGGPGCSDAECCEQVCAVDPFCCDVAWDTLCVGGAQTLCVDCVTDPCPGGAVLENEACGTDTNGGCNSTPPVYTDILCGDTVCGNMWASGGTRDTDWYRFTTAGGDVTWSVQSDFAAIAVFLVNNDCGAVTVLAVGSGVCPTVATANLAAGTYIAFVATSGFDGLPCPGADYVGILSCP